MNHRSYRSHSQPQDISEQFSRALDEAGVRRSANPFRRAQQLVYWRSGRYAAARALGFGLLAGMAALAIARVGASGETLERSEPERAA